MLTYDDRPKHAPDHRGEKRHGNDRVDDGSSAKRHRHNKHRESRSGGKHHGRGEHISSGLAIVDDDEHEARFLNGMYRDVTVRFRAGPNWSWSINLTRIRPNTELECNHPKLYQSMSEPVIAFAI